MSRQEWLGRLIIQSSPEENGQRRTPRGWECNAVGTAKHLELGVVLLFHYGKAVGV